MKFNFTAVVSLAGAVLFSSLIASAKPSEVSRPQNKYTAKSEIIVKNVPYVEDLKNNPDLMLDVYSNKHEAALPVIVMIHGGAWFKGSKEMENYVFLADALAASGYAVFSINHRLAPKVKVKAEVEDAMAAVIWVKEHATEYGGDPEKIAVLGGSSGGHLAALIAWASDDPYFTPTGGKASGIDSDVDAAALLYPVLDFDRTIRENASILQPFAHSLLVGKHGKRYRKELQHLSPINHIDSSVVPTIFLTGDKDSLKLYPQSVEFYKRLSSLGVPTELYTARGKSHSFTSQYWEPETAEAIDMIKTFFKKHIK